MKILALECSAKMTGAAVGDETALFAECNTSARLTHSQTLMPMVDMVLSCAGLTLADIDCFAVGAGPGSFTGLRIGIAAVKGLAMGCGRPCAGVSTLESLARNLPEAEGILCAAMDARCGQVYTALFENRPEGLLRLTADQALSIEELSDQLAALGGEKPIFFVGDGAELCVRHKALTGRLNRMRLAADSVRFQKASGVLVSAREQIREGKLVSPAALLPVYLRLPQAQRNLMAKNGERP